MVTFTVPILKIATKGGWSYCFIDRKYAQQIKPGTKKSFRVKGTLDKHPIRKTSLLPMRDGNFMLPVNAAIRKATGKKAGDKLTICIELDERKLTLSKVLIQCLKDDPEALYFFRSLSPSNQQYFSKWVEDAKTAPTKARRITITLMALNKKMNYTDMLQAMKTFDV